MPLPQFVRGMLNGVRVLDLTRVLAGPYATLMLADLGAEIIKIEEPGEGDTARRLKAGDFDIAPYFAGVNRSKLSVTLDLKKEEGRKVFHELVAKSDVVVNNYRPGVLTRLGCDYDTLKVINPRIIACSISGFGKTGPNRDLAAYDLIVQAMGGGMDITGYPDGPPAVMGFHIGDEAAGLFGALAIVTALYHRERTGEGQDIDISMLDCQYALLGYLGQIFLMGGDAPKRSGTAHPLVAPFKAFQTADGYIAVGSHHDKQWTRLCRVLGVDHLVQDARFLGVMDRSKNRDALYEVMEPVFRRESTAHWLAALQPEGIPCGPVNTVPQALDEARAYGRNMIVETENQWGQYEILGNPIKTTAQEDAQFGPPAALGEHTEMVLKDLLGKSDEKIEELKARSAI